LSLTRAAARGVRIGAAVPLLLIGSVLGLVALFLIFYAAIFIYVVAVSGDHGLMDEAYIRHNALWLIPGIILAAFAASAVGLAVVVAAVKILDRRQRSKPLPIATEQR